MERPVDRVIRLGIFSLFFFFSFSFPPLGHLALWLSGSLGPPVFAVTTGTALVRSGTAL